jgi:tagaturonate epimerase
MENWQPFCQLISSPESQIEELREFARKNFSLYGVYPDSIHQLGNTVLFMARGEKGKCLVAAGPGHDIFANLDGIRTHAGGSDIKVCPLSNENCLLLRNEFPYIKPSSHQRYPVTIGLGDRLGLASPGHIRLARNFGFFPVLAQQSIRELTLTNRTYEDVLAASAWAVFQEGYHGGYGADGDHLKTSGEVRVALDTGFTMITLDCSEHIHRDVEALSEGEIADRYRQLPDEIQERYDREYAGRTFFLPGGHPIEFSLDELKKTVLIYHDAIRFAIQIYHDVIEQAGRSIDFEMSIDETTTPTKPAAHYFTASELIRGGVKLVSLAPRFCGEFQKGVDYRGDVGQFFDEFAVHADIAGSFGYKISVHSGSDKFKIFPIVGELSGGRYHLKTAGTNWLEAVRLAAMLSPELYRRMHHFALENLAAARKYYHISAEPAGTPPLDSVPDQDLPELLKQDDVRQILHITYGYILSAKNPDGRFTYKDDLYAFLYQHEKDYNEVLYQHIRKHCQSLGLPESGVG